LKVLFVLLLFEFARDETFLRARTKVSVVLERFNTEVDHCPSDLHCFIEARHKRSLVFDQNEGPKLGKVVLKLKLVVLEFDDGMASRD
jgi:hypothetical protein